MTHLEEFVRVLDLMGIKYKREDAGPTPPDFGWPAFEGQTMITIGTGEGYVCFYGEFVFDPDGKFKYHALLE